MKKALISTQKGNSGLFLTSSGLIEPDWLTAFTELVICFANTPSGEAADAVATRIIPQFLQQRANSVYMMSSDQLMQEEEGGFFSSGLCPGSFRSRGAVKSH